MAYCGTRAKLCIAFKQISDNQNVPDFPPKIFEEFKTQFDRSLICSLGGAERPKRTDLMAVVKSQNASSYSHFNRHKF